MVALGVRYYLRNPDIDEVKKYKYEYTSKFFVSFKILFSDA